VTNGAKSLMRIVLKTRPDVEIRQDGGSLASAAAGALPMEVTQMLPVGMRCVGLFGEEVVTLKNLVNGTLVLCSSFSGSESVWVDSSWD
jgi:hypothetical protein